MSYRKLAITFSVAILSITLALSSLFMPSNTHIAYALVTAENTPKRLIEIKDTEHPLTQIPIKLDHNGVVRAVDSPALNIPQIIQTETSKTVVYPISLPKGYNIVSLNGIDALYFTNQAQELVGMIDYAYGFDHNNTAVKARLSVNNQGIVFNFPAEVHGQIYIAYLNATGNQGLGTKSMFRSASVGIPSDYIYDPSLGSLHDYCTSSPDSFLSADFRGPCARHDMCYDQKGCASKTCDAKLYEDLATNCRAAFGNANPLRATCLATANIYWAAVRGAHVFSACE